MSFVVPHLLTLAPSGPGKVLVHLESNRQRAPAIRPRRSVMLPERAKKRKLSHAEPLAKEGAPPERASKPTVLLTDDRLRQHSHPQRRHSECPERLSRTLEFLEQSGLVSRCEGLTCEEPSEKELCAVHSPFYLQRLKSLRTAPRERLIEEAAQYDSVYLNEHSIECAMLAAGGVLKLARQIWSGSAQNGIALVRPAGHHAGVHNPSGFCLINSVAVAAKQLLCEGCERVMIVDWDIHHGDGTQKVNLRPRCKPATTLKLAQAGLYRTCAATAVLCPPPPSLPSLSPVSPPSPHTPSPRGK